MGNHQSTSILESKKVVVVGGGFAGAHAIRHLQGKCQLTVIDPREYLHYSIGSLRASVQPGFEKNIFVSHNEAWGQSFKQGRVTSVDPERKVVILEDGEEVQYDIVVIATGSSVPFPGKVGLNVTTSAEAEELFKEFQGKIKTANRITIVGGGAVGVELAGEIATDYSEKEITLINDKDDIIHVSFKEKFRQKAKEQLEAMGIKLILGERVSNLDELTTDGSQPCSLVKTDKGREIETDLVIHAIGIQANCDAYKDNFADKLDERNFLKVNKFLQVDGYTDVFAVGDCNNADQVKMATKAMNQMEVLAQNIKALVDNGEMIPYKEETIMTLSTGRNSGVTQFKSVVFGSLLTKKLKSQHVFIHRFWKETMGLDLKE
ncbi:ferroptosis suppressor protein 1-like [Apostichopus japonicus]|uniref:ferroptosis suppressor protein 1-like n=1 Tax=Stichopus japonicus TaxID=307972 RepID=UPI003AB15D41